MRLNRFLASAGIASRRKADELIFDRQVKVNGQVVVKPGIDITEQDFIELQGKTIKSIKEKIYLAVNKPIGVVSTCHDPNGKPIILDVLRSTPYNKYRNILKPVGRLDQNTSGVILLTNDGELHHHLTHPSREFVKEYEVELTSPLPLAILRNLRSGIRLADGYIKPDHIDYLNPKIKHVIVIRLHSGRNRIIRRMLEAVGVIIKTLKRTNFAGVKLELILRKAGKRAYKHSDGVVVPLSVEMVENLKQPVTKMKRPDIVSIKHSPRISRYHSLKKKSSNFSNSSSQSSKSSKINFKSKEQ